jgi:hypothetical protein
MPIENIEKGQYLAASLKYDKITQFDGSYLIRRFEEYRKKVREVNFRNSTLRKKIAFWEPQETVEPFDPTKGTIIECDRKTVLDFFKDSYILSKTPPPTQDIVPLLWLHSFLFAFGKKTCTSCKFLSKLLQI